MPAAMESSQNIENPLEFSIFLQIPAKCFYFLEISGILPGSRESAPRSRRPGSGSLGRARDLSARPKSSESHNPEKSVSGAAPTVNFFLVGWKLSKSLIPDVLEFLPDFYSPQPNGNFECRGCPDSSDWLIGSHIGRTPNPRVPEPGGNQ